MVEVCPDCDIAGCVHIRERTGAFAPTQPQGLLPCPFCGGDDLRRSQDGFNATDRVTCNGCKANAVLWKWNQRTPTPPLSLGEEAIAAHFASWRDRWKGRVTGHTKIEPCDRVAAQNLLASLLSQPTTGIKSEGDATDRKDVAACVSSPTIGGSPAPQPEDALVERVESLLRGLVAKCGGYSENYQWTIKEYGNEVIAAIRGNHGTS